MSNPRWRTIDVPDVPDPSATQPPTRVQLEELEELLPNVPKNRSPMESLRPVSIGTPISAPPRSDDTSMWIYGMIAIVLLVALVMMFSSSVLAVALFLMR